LAVSFANFGFEGHWQAYDRGGSDTTPVVSNNQPLRDRAVRDHLPQSIKPARHSRLDHEVDRLRALAFLVRLDLETDPLSFGQVLQSRPLDRGDVDEYIAAAIIGLDEAIAAFSIEELDRSSHGHRETPPPSCSAAYARLRIGPTGQSLPESLATLGAPVATPAAWIFLGLDHSAATIRGSGT
jgi:hypothetical protein